MAHQSGRPCFLTCQVENGELIKDGSITHQVGRLHLCISHAMHAMRHLPQVANAVYLCCRCVSRPLSPFRLFFFHGDAQECLGLCSFHIDVVACSLLSIAYLLICISAIVFSCSPWFSRRPPRLRGLFPSCVLTTKA